MFNASKPIALKFCNGIRSDCANIFSKPTDHDFPNISGKRVSWYLFNISKQPMVFGYFMDKLTDHLFIFEGNGIIKDEYCSYSEYREKQVEQEKNKKTNSSVENKQQVKSNGSNKVSYKDKYEYEQLEKDIEKLETTKKELEEDLLQEGLSFQDINQKSEKLGEIIQELDDKTMRWLELDELM